MTLISLALNVLLVAILWNYNYLRRLSIEPCRTLWQKKHYGWMLYEWKYPANTPNGNWGRPLFKLQWRPEPKDQYVFRISTKENAPNI
jgi:hypothetical protein